MVNHGFGILTLKSSKPSEATKMNIAKCISNVPGIVYAHTVHEVFTVDSKVDEIAKKVDHQWDILFEMERKLSKSERDKIYACAREKGHESSLTLITTKHPNYQRGRDVKHP